MKKHQALALALIILGSAVCDAVGQQGPAESNQPASSGKPNVIYILADDLGYGDLSCYGQKKFQTPNIDRLASEGMKFTDHYSGRAVCSPSRACLMTGQHPGRIHCPAPTSTASETPGGIGGNQKINRNRDFSVGRDAQPSLRGRADGDVGAPGGGVFVHVSAFSKKKVGMDRRAVPIFQRSCRYIFPSSDPLLFYQKSQTLGNM